MSIRLLAQDLYRSQTEVERLEKALAAAPIEKRNSIEDKLRKAKAQRASLRSALDGQLSKA